MNNGDLLAIVACGGVGFAAVYLAMSHRPPPVAPPPPAPPAAPDWARVLELPPEASVDEIHDAYRRLIGQYHPDKVASLGRELRELAEAKTREIEGAYQAALMARGAAR